MEILQIEDWDGQSHRIEIEKNEKIEKTKKREKSLLSILREQHLYIDAPCDGKGECGKCRVQFLEGTPEPTGKEKNFLPRQNCRRESGLPVR